MKAIAALALIATPIFAQRDYPVKPVPFTAVHVTDAFWAPRIETNRKITIPYAFGKDEETGRVDNFIRAAKALHGQPLENRQPPGYPFDDTDVYKVIEGASYALSVAPDPRLDAYVDGLIAKIGAAQEKDGYLYTTRSIDPLHPHPWAGLRRWMLETDLSHELYNLGHLYEAAVAHYQATGKRTLLDIAIRSADLLAATFGPGKQGIWPGHQIAEMGLAKLYRATGEQRYLELAKFLLDSRGPGALPAAGRTYNQSHKKVVEQDEAVGHAVRATYMYSGMADVAALTGDSAYVGAIDRIWENVAGKKLYITGGIGAKADGEAFGGNYELPNMTAYNETCAAIGNDYWNHRLFLLHGDAKYIDVMERTLYNGLISGVSLDGKTFFYPNPLESNGQHERSPWFGCACCPGNITRFMASVPGYVYAEHGDAIWVNLYMANHAEVKLDNGRVVKFTQETQYPWDGAVKMTIAPDRAAQLTLHVRIPGWARNEPVASDLYQFSDPSNEQATVKVNGKPVALKIEKGYADLTRTWQAGDTIELNLPMPVRRVVANKLVEADRSRVAIERGPIVYAAEWVDNPNGKVRHLVLPYTAKLTPEHRMGMLNGVTVIKGRALGLAYDTQGKVVKAEQELTLIPYYAWANRGRGQMMVWLPALEAIGRPLPYPTLTTSAKVTASGKKNPEPVKDGDEPASSSDSTSYFDWWPQGTKSGGTPRVTSGWIEYEFGRASEVSESQLYWFDDTGHGEARVPLKWRILYRDGEQWKPVVTQQTGGVDRNRYNRLSFKPVTTTGLRLEVEFQSEFSAGVERWRVK